MARNLLTLTISAPTSDPAQDEGGNFTFTVTPGFAGGGGVTAYDLDLQWDQGTATWQTIPGSGGLSTAGTAYYASTTQDTAFTITVDCNTAGSYNIRAINTSRSITSTPTSQAVTVNAPAGDVTEDPLLVELDLLGFIPQAIVANNVNPGIADPSPTITGYAPTTVVANNVSPGIADPSPLITGYAPTLARADVVTPSTTQLQFVYVIGLKLEGQPLTIDVGGGDNTELPLLGTMSLSGSIPEAIVGNVTLPGTDALVLGEQTPTRLVGENREPSTDALVLGVAGSDLTVLHDRVSAPDTIALSLDGKSASVDRAVVPDTVALSLDGKVPTVPDSGAIEVPTGGLNIYQYIGLKLDTFPPSISIADTVSPSTIGLSLSGSTADLNVTVLPSTVSVDFSGIIPTVSGTVSPGTGALVLQGYQTADQDTVIVPVGSLALAGIAPSLKGVTAPTTIGLSLSGQPLTVDYIAAPSPSTVSLGLSSVAPSAIQSHITTTSTGALSLAGTIPVRYVDAAGSFTRAPNTAALTLAGQSVAASGLKLVDPIGVSLSLSGKIPTAEVDKTVSPSTAGLVLYSANRVIGTARFNLTGQPVTIAYHDGTLIQNLDASTDIISNIEECDYSGFKVMPGSLKMTWNRYAVRQKSYEDRHPSDVPHRTHPQRKRGPQRPEPDDTFLDTDVSPEDY